MLCPNCHSTTDNYRGRGKRRRKGEAENPYLAARRTWNDHVGSVLDQRRTMQIVMILALLIALASVGGMTYIGSQSPDTGSISVGSRYSGTTSLWTVITRRGTHSARTRPSEPNTST